MGLIPQPVIDDVLARTDIVQVVQQYVTLKRAGTNHKGLCPFHNEKTPSFNVSASKGIYKCFGCGAGGNVLGFLMGMEGWNFPESVRHLAERHGIEIPEESDEDREEARKRRDAKKAYQHVMQLAQAFYEKSLWSDAGRAARQYLQERRIDDETVRVFGLGYAPEGWQNLLDELARHDIPPAWAERAGLALPRRQGGGFYDRFRQRVMFPVVDIWGNTLAFGGRVLAANDDGPKYMNSSETKFYVKGRQLYGLYPAKQAIQQNESAIIVEGNFDVVALYAQGIRNVVAPMGTALTEQQAALLARYTRKVAVAFDGDSAGQKATVRCLPAFEEAGIEARVVPLEDGEDPDSFVMRHGADAFMDLVGSAEDLVLWAFDQTLPRAENGDIHRNVEGAESAAELLGMVKNPALRTRYVKELSRRLAIEPRVLNEYIKRPRSLGEEIKKAVAAAHKPLELEPAEMGVLTVLMDHPEWLDGFLSEEYDRLLNSEELSDFLHHAAKQRIETERLEPAVLLESVDHQGFRRTVERAFFTRDYNDDRAGQWYDDCVRALKRNWADRTLLEIVRDLEGTDFERQRAEFEALIEKQKRVIQFKQAL